MAVSGNPYATLKKALASTLKDQERTRNAMAKTVKVLLKEQFTAGINPYGVPQPQTKRGKPGLVSKHLPNAIKVTPTISGVAGVGELKDSRGKKAGRAATPRAASRQWLTAHQEGHVFPARESRGHRLFFNPSGQALRRARTQPGKLKPGEKSMLKRGGNVTRTLGLKLKRTKRVVIGEREYFWQLSRTESKLRGYSVKARAHTVKSRVLPRRMIYPMPNLGARWGNALKVAIDEVLKRQLEKNVKSG